MSSEAMTDWAAEHLGIELRDDGGVLALHDLVRIGVRRNPRRVHLLVSTVLGKHIPAAPQAVAAMGYRLGHLAAPAVGRVEDAVVLGYAETATGLGHLVAEAVGADYVHSTRRDLGPTAVTFDEEHSHARRHLLLPDDPQLLCRPGPVVLVDDELSTGRTVLNTIAALQRLRRRDRYLVATLVDVRDERARDAFGAAAAALGVRVDVVSLAQGSVFVPTDVHDRVRPLLERSAAPTPSPGRAGVRPGRIDAWPGGVRSGGRHGFTAADADAARTSARACAAALAPSLIGSRVLVLGTEELIYAPLLVALELQAVTPDAVVRFSSTTRSPVAVVDEPGYPVRTGIAFASTDASTDEPGMRYAYNVAPPAGVQPYTDVVLVVDDDADTAALWADDGLVAQLSTSSRVHVLVVPAGRSALTGVSR
jgi:adenine/guanine phosphoribosyltransferase-like PRPP-binding protein